LAKITNSELFTVRCYNRAVKGVTINNSRRKNFVLQWK